MIVKNESQVIKRCLDSVKPIIDTWIIIDTGSTDNTKDIILSELKNIEGELIDSKWVNFAHNRNELLKFAFGKSDYLLLLDADEEVVVDSRFSKHLSENSYRLRYVGHLDYAVTLLIKSDLKWRYVGVTHEYIESDPSHQSSELPEITVIHHYDGGSRHDKFERDIRLLTKDIEDNPDNSRSVFYLAQSYRDIQDYKEAKYWYVKRVYMEGWDEEQWYARYQVGEMYRLLGVWENALDWYLKAYNFRPTRVEPLYHIIQHYMDKGQFQVAYLFAKTAASIPYPTDVLFIHRNMYQYLIPDQLSVCAYYVGHFYESQNLCDQLLDILPDSKRISDNRSYANKKTKQLVFGLGTGRCGTMSLQGLLNQQTGVCVSHESIISPWLFSQTYLDRILKQVHGYDGQIVGDIACYYLNYVEHILSISPQTIFICLKRDKEETIRSYIDWTPDKNHWTHKHSIYWDNQWVDDAFDLSYPKYDLPKSESISAYWEDYYAYAEHLCRRYPHNFFIHPLEDLNSREGQENILSVLIDKNSIVYDVGIKLHENKDIGAKTRK